MKKIITVIVSLVLAALLPLSLASCEIVIGGASSSESTPADSSPADSKPGESTPADSTPAHSHVWQTEYTCDDTEHWHKCTECDATSGHALHEFDESWKCDVCGHSTVKKLLVVESVNGESERLVSLLDECYSSKVVNVGDSTNLPSDAEELREYDGVVLVNVANRDMPGGFDTVLHTYVSRLGGSLLTVCGSKEGSDGREFNAFTREDMYGTAYQELLPVEIVDYAPSSAVIFLVDNSGSMYSPGGSIAYESSLLYRAIMGVESAIDAMRDSDYVGVMNLLGREFVPLTQRANDAAIREGLKKLERGGSTIFSEALYRAGQQLEALSGVDNRHIVLITDGAISPDDVDHTLRIMSENEKKGITISFIGLHMTAANKAQMMGYFSQTLSDESYEFYDTNADSLIQITRECVERLGEKELVYADFKPTANADHPVLSGVDVKDVPTLDGFYYCQLKSGAEAALMGEISPIYASHSVGEGRVGSFMCDLSGVWSAEFIGSEAGQRIVNNMIRDVLVRE